MSTNRSWKIGGKQLGKLLLFLLPIMLLWWTLRQVEIEQVWSTLRNLNPLEVAIWLLVNIGLVIAMSGRWWLILRASGCRIPYLSLTRYRLASYAVSYFTPGPQFGGEPIQVLALQQRHAVPGTTSTASVGLDKLFELISNFSFLVFGIAITLSGSWLPNQWRSTGLAFSLGLLALPLAYLTLILSGRQPLNLLISRLPENIAHNWISAALGKVEDEMAVFCIHQPGTVLLAVLISVCIWVGMVLEYWLLTYFLGLRLSFLEVISALTAARLAFLTPLPGGLGILETSQFMAMQTLGLDPAYGVSLSLLIRLRDILFGIAGLIYAASLLGWWYFRDWENRKDG